VILLVLAIAHHVAALPSARRMGWTFCLLALATGMICATWEHTKPTWVLLSLCLVENARRVRVLHIVTGLNRGGAEMMRYESPPLPRR
jgi:hypothetical protein